MLEEIENVEFVQGVCFEFFGSLKNNESQNLKYLTIRMETHTA